MPFSIRKATSSDMDGVLKLINELAVYEKEPDAVKITAQTLRDHGLGAPPFYLFCCNTSR